MVRGFAHYLKDVMGKMLFHLQGGKDKLQFEKLGRLKECSFFVVMKFSWLPWSNKVIAIKSPENYDEVMAKVRAMIKNEDGTYTGYIYSNCFDLFFNQKNHSELRRGPFNGPQDGLVFFFLTAEVKNSYEGTLLECKVFVSPFWWLVLLVFTAAFVWFIYSATQGYFEYKFLMLLGTAYLILTGIYNWVRITFVKRVLTMFNGKIVK